VFRPFGANDHGGHSDSRLLTLIMRSRLAADSLTQTVAIPASCASATLTYWLHVATAETTTSTAFDTLTVTVGGTTVASYSNLNAASGYAQRTVNLSSYIGQTVPVSFTGVEGSIKHTVVRTG
jgi:hypothetical protein